MSIRAEHAPDPYPQCKCGMLLHKHRVYHAFEGYGARCTRCQLLPVQHRHDPRKRRPAGERKLYPRSPAKALPFWGIDGEGQGREDHKYVLLAAGDETGTQKLSIEGNLSTVQCLEFILQLPKYAKLFAYSFNYDLTKILADLPNKDLYLLFHEELRQRSPKKRHLGPTPILWGPYAINLQRTKFTVRKLAEKRVIWDVWKFYQSKFVTALDNWGLGDGIEHMRVMKEKRADFDRLTLEVIKPYCFLECQKLGQLARKLTDAHAAAGIKLRNYYGAGSSAAGMLKNMGITRHEPLPEMTDAVTRAFFGGRFENAIIGAFPGPIHSYDISSAYPYQLTRLPCLQHGTWRFTKKRSALEGARQALINYRYEGNPEATWAPFPYREASGNICFPNGSNSGWVYRDEYLAGERLFPGVRLLGAWVYETHCSCEPFSKIPEYYRARALLGKDAAGIVLKLGMNSCYGKLAQSLGWKPPFQSWIWAGMITSGCRAQILELASRLSSLDQLLMVATDGVYTSERINSPPMPLDTGTSDLPEPLGGWEYKIVRKGVFAARPGIYFPLDPTSDELKEVRARGVGKAILLECWETITKAWERGDENVVVANLVRFNGAKNSISVRGIKTGNLSFHRSPSYGQWERRPVELSFSPLPKRESVADDGISLRLRTVDGESRPYDCKLSETTPEAQALKAAEAEAQEQPDGGDLTEDWG